MSQILKTGRPLPGQEFRPPPPPPKDFLDLTIDKAKDVIGKVNPFTHVVDYALWTSGKVSGQAKENAKNIGEGAGSIIDNLFNTNPVLLPVIGIGLVGVVIIALKI